MDVTCLSAERGLPASEGDSLVFSHHVCTAGRGAVLGARYLCVATDFHTAAEIHCDLCGILMESARDVLAAYAS